MTQEIIRTLKKLSSASEEALESLEAYDYRQKVKHLKDNQLPLHYMPKTIRQIFNSVMKYRCTISSLWAPPAPAKLSWLPDSSELL